MVIHIPAEWVNGITLEKTLSGFGDPLTKRAGAVRFVFPVNCKVMLDAAAKVLSLANQLAWNGTDVTLDFEEGTAGTMGYLDRLGFFDLLSPQIQTMPARPWVSGARIYQGHNSGLVELAPMPVT